MWEGRNQSPEHTRCSLIPELHFPVLRDISCACVVQICALYRGAELHPLTFKLCRKQIWNGNCWGTPAAPAALLPAPEGSHSLSKCLCEIKIDHLFPQILSNNLSLIKRKILFAWLPVVLERNSHPCLQLWGKWGKAINDLGRGTSGIIHWGTWCALLPAGHKTSALSSSNTLQIFWRPWNCLLGVYFGF